MLNYKAPSLNIVKIETFNPLTSSDGPMSLVTSPLAEQSAVLHTSTSLSCSAEAVPSPEYEWLQETEAGEVSTVLCCTVLYCTVLYCTGEEAGPHPHPAARGRVVRRPGPLQVIIELSTNLSRDNPQYTPCLWSLTPFIFRCVASNTIGSQRREKQSELIKIDVSGAL